MRGGRKPPDGKLRLDHRTGFQYPGDHNKCEGVKVMHSKAETLGINKGSKSRPRLSGRLTPVPSLGP